MGGILRTIGTAHAGLLHSVLLALALLAATPRPGLADRYELRGYDIIVAHGLTEARIHDLVQARRKGSGAGRREMAVLAEKLGVQEAALAGFLDLVVERGVTEGAFLLGFAEIAARHAALTDRLAVPDPALDPAVAALVRDARAAVAGGDYGSADALLARAEEAARQGSGDDGGLSLPAAALRGARGELSRLRLDPLEAAKHFRMAAKLVPPQARIERADYLSRCAGALATYGVDEDDAGTLAQVAEVLNDLLQEISREETPIRWAEVENYLGQTLSNLGEREGDTALLERAILAQRAALEEQTRQGASLDQAFTRDDLASALKDLGKKRGGTEELEEAVAVYRAALEGLNREHRPIAWASVRNDMGTTLAVLGDRKEDSALMRQAIEAFRSSMEEFTRERVPFGWSMSQHNLGTALGELAMIERDPALLEQAADAYRAALEEQTRERKPRAWAGTQSTLAFVLYRLGEWQRNPALLEQAAETYRVTMEVWTRERDPLRWAEMQTCMGEVLITLAKEVPGTAHLEQAADAFRSALEVFKAEGEDHYAAIVTEYLDRIQAALKERDIGADRPSPE